MARELLVMVAMISPLARVFLPAIFAFQPALASPQGSSRDIDIVPVDRFILEKHQNEGHSWLYFYLDRLSQYGRWGRRNGSNIINTVTDRKLDSFYSMIRQDSRPLSDPLTYLRASAFSMHYGNIVNGSQSKTSAPPQERSLENQRWSFCDSTFENLGAKKLTLLVDVLAQSGKIVPLIPETRARLGGIWTQRSESRNPSIPGYRVYGGYQCQRDLIYVEPGLRPFNSFALLIHELDHRYRAMTSRPTSLSVRNQVLLDELLSYATSGLIQLHLKRRNGMMVRENPWEKLTPWAHPVSAAFRISQKLKNHGGHFQPKSDLTMYNRAPEGALQKIYSIQRSSICKSMDFILEELARGNAGDPGVAELIRAISKGNFQVDHSADFLAEMQQHFSRDAAPTLFHLLSKSDDADSPTFRAELKKFAEPPAPDRLALCDQFETAAQLGELGLYVGIVSRNQSIRSGGEGVKGTDSTTKPGGEGVKADDSLVRACTGIGF